MNKQILSHYLQYSQYTYPGLFEKNLKETLPNTVREIGSLVRSQLMHRMVLKNGNTGSNTDLRYGDTSRIPWYRQPEDDVFLTASAMIAELYRRDQRGITNTRAPENMLVLTCRYTAILMATCLKIKGIPARVRSGFAPYFVVEGLPSGKSDDHWINEYWHEQENRWITIDVDGSIEGYLSFDPYDIPKGTFDFAADAWLRIRNNNIDESHFYNAGGYSGLIAVAWELFYDFHSIMNDEIPYTHVPLFTRVGAFEKQSETDLREIDSLAILMQKPDDNFFELQKIWETNKKFRLLAGGLL